MIAAWKLAVAVVAVYATVILFLSRNLWGDASSLEALSFGRRAGTHTHSKPSYVHAHTLPDCNHVLGSRNVSPTCPRPPLALQCCRGLFARALNTCGCQVRRGCPAAPHTHTRAKVPGTPWLDRCAARLEPHRRAPCPLLALVWSGLGNAGKLDHWLRFEGACADRRSRGRSSRYVEIKVTGMDLCMQVCESMPTCMAFTLGDGLRCSVTTQCGTHAAGDGPADVTFVKKNVAAGAAVAEDDDALAPRAPKQHLEDCSYCPPQNQCEQPRMCRAGRCFHGLPEKDGTACSDGDATTEGERCIKGRCTAFEDGFAVEDHSHMAHRALQAFNIHLQTQCLQEYVVAAMDYDAERCAKVVSRSACAARPRARPPLTPKTTRAHHVCWPRLARLTCDTHAPSRAVPLRSRSDQCAVAC